MDIPGGRYTEATASGPLHLSHPASVDCAGTVGGDAELDGSGSGPENGEMEESEDVEGACLPGGDSKGV